MHGNLSKINSWKFIFKPISNGNFHFKTICTIYKDCIDVFTVDKNGTLIQYYANPSTKWQYIKK
jgi:hypothetical protein